MAAYPGYIEKRRSAVLENAVLDTDRVTGTVKLDEPRLLVLSIPYDGGWTAYVDGEKTDLMRANVMHCAVALQHGEHTIELIYHMPGLRTGVVISLTAVLILAGLGLYQKRKRR